MSEDVTKRVLSFWFGPPEADGTLARREAWFKKDPAFDEAIAAKFSVDCERALAGDLNSLMKTAEGCLALIILLDQFPRNIFRGSPRAFASDEKARQVARHVLDKEFDQGMQAVERLFLYLPFEHSEDVVDQERMLELTQALGDDRLIEYARRHFDIIACFGRFPHRNEALGRESTEEEKAFLEQPDSSF